MGKTQKRRRPSFPICQLPILSVVLLNFCPDLPPSLIPLWFFSHKTPPALNVYMKTPRPTPVRGRRGRGRWNEWRNECVHSLRRISWLRMKNQTLSMTLADWSTTPDFQYKTLNRTWSFQICIYCCIIISDWVPLSSQSQQIIYVIWRYISCFPASYQVGNAALFAIAFSYIIIFLFFNINLKRSEQHTQSWAVCIQPDCMSFYCQSRKVGGQGFTGGSAWQISALWSHCSVFSLDFKSNLLPNPHHSGVLRCGFQL